MEAELARNLIDLGTRYGESRGIEETTVGRLCAQDGRFFTRIRDGKTFTAKKYDEVISWFSENWPTGADWPNDIARPDERAGVAA